MTKLNVAKIKLLRFNYFNYILNLKHAIRQKCYSLNNKPGKYN